MTGAPPLCCRDGAGCSSSLLKPRWPLPSDDMSDSLTDSCDSKGSWMNSQSRALLGRKAGDYDDMTAAFGQVLLTLPECLFAKCRHLGKQQPPWVQESTKGRRWLGTPAALLLTPRQAPRRLPGWMPNWRPDWRPSCPAAPCALSAGRQEKSRQSRPAAIAGAGAHCCENAMVMHGCQGRCTSRGVEPECRGDGR